MRHLGDPAFTFSDGGRSQLILFDEAGPRYTIHTDLLVGKLHLVSATTGTAMLTASLTAPGDTLLIPAMEFAEVWSEDRGGHRFRLSRLRVDHMHARRSGGNSELTIHGRGPLGPLIDQRCQAVFAGDLQVFVAEKCRTAARTEVLGLAARPVTIYANMDSTYAALRLLAVSLGFVVKEDLKTDTIQVRALDVERDRLARKPIVHLDDTNSRAESYTKGTPLKKRT